VQTNSCTGTGKHQLKGKISKMVFTDGNEGAEILFRRLEKLNIGSKEDFIVYFSTKSEFAYTFRSVDRYLSYFENRSKTKRCLTIISLIEKYRKYLVKVELYKKIKEASSNILVTREDVLDVGKTRIK
jgi:hypothetical protein